MSGAIHALLGFPPEPFKTPLSPPRQPPARKPFGSRRRRRRRRKSRRDIALYPLAPASRRALHLVSDRSATRSLAKQPLERPRGSCANPDTDNARIFRGSLHCAVSSRPSLVLPSARRHTCANVNLFILFALSTNLDRFLIRRMPGRNFSVV